MKKLILSADDFGLDEAVNEAVEIAHREGVLTSASLMVGEDAAADAVARAKRLPGLCVGLHLVLADGRPVLPPGTIPDLVDRAGRFPRAMVGAGFRFFFLPAVRRQLAREIRAQFEAFARTGLKLDHVNAHKHFHLHPTVARLILAIGRDYGLHAVRVPAEPVGVAGGIGTRALNLWTRQLRRAVRRAGCISNDHVFGLAWTGAVTEARLLGLLPHLPDGVSEIYFHPGDPAHRRLAGLMPDYRHRDEFEALTSPRVRAALDALAIERIGFGALADLPA